MGSVNGIQLMNRTPGMGIGWNLKWQYTSLIAS